MRSHMGRGRDRVGESLPVCHNVHTPSSLRVPPGTEQDVHKAFCIPLAMYTLADDDIISRDVACKLS